jgi:outer membrane protein assembly factor BamA
MASSSKLKLLLLIGYGLLLGNLCSNAYAQEIDPGRELSATQDPQAVKESMPAPDAIPGQDAIPAPELLSDDQLESKHARIGHIEVVIDDIFENETRKNIYHVINSLHISTRTNTIIKQLLFRAGDPYERRVLDETERLLRSQRYLNAASITPQVYHADNTVDILVRVHDVWTFQPGISFSRKGGANSSRAELEETNLFGLGKQISFQSANNPDRSELLVAYTDPNLFASHWQMSASYADLSDGTDRELSFTRPFYSLDDRWGFSLTGADMRSAEALYSLGEIANQFDLHRQGFEIGGGWSAGAQDDHALRYLAGFRYQSKAFTPTPETTVLPEDRVVSYPWIGIERLQDEYIKVRNFDKMDRTEDVNLGTVVHVELGYSSSTFGATHEALMFNGSLRSGLEPANGHYLLGNIGLNGRLESDHLQGATLDAVGRYYKKQSEHRTLFTSLQLTHSLHLDGDQQLLLGGDNGLRGYPARFQAGTSLTLATIEERFYTNWQPLKLFNVGAAVFVDAGRTWGVDPAASAPLGWLADAGVGLRIGSARSHHGNILHIDVGFPINLGRTIDDQRVSGVQLLIETRTSF